MIKREYFLDNFGSTLKNYCKFKKIWRQKRRNMPILIPLFWLIFAHFEKWVLTLKSYNSKTTQPNLKSYTSKFKLDYPPSNKSIFRVVQEFIRSHEADKRPKLFLDHPVGKSGEKWSKMQFLGFLLRLENSLNLWNTN